MPDSFIQLPADSTGKKIATRTFVQGADTVHKQAMYQEPDPTFYLLADSVVPAAAKHHLTVWNGHASALVRVKKLFAIATYLGAAVTGLNVRYDVKRLNAAPTVGTLLTTTPNAVGNITQMDTNDALPAGIEARVAPTVAGASELGIFFPVVLLHEEQTITTPLDRQTFQSYQNLIVESPELKEPILRPSQGLTIKQITTATIASISWLMAITVET